MSVKNPLVIHRMLTKLRFIHRWKSNHVIIWKMIKQIGFCNWQLRALLCQFTKHFDIRSIPNERRQWYDSSLIWVKLQSIGFLVKAVLINQSIQNILFKYVLYIMQDVKDVVFIRSPSRKLLSDRQVTSSVDQRMKHVTHKCHCGWVFWVTLGYRQSEFKCAWTIISLVHKDHTIPNYQNVGCMLMTHAIKASKVYHINSQMKASHKLLVDSD
jgi:hypothetical protein